MNQSKKPLDNPLVRQAIAHGLDKAGVVSFYAGQGRVANEFLPPALPGFSKSGVPEYAYDPEKSKALLRQAGLTIPLEIEFAYPTSVARPYMPDPKRNSEALGASLEKAGFKVTFKSAPWRPDYRATLQSGGYQLFLFGWIARLPGSGQLPERPFRVGPGTVRLQQSEPVHPATAGGRGVERRQADRLLPEGQQPGDAAAARVCRTCGRAMDRSRSRRTYRATSRAPSAR